MNGQSIIPEPCEQIISPITFMTLPFHQSNIFYLSSIVIRWILDRFQNEKKYDVTMHLFIEY